jgi:hypothetical protein
MLWTEETDKALSDAAQAASPGQGAVVETQRRLRFAIETLEVATNALSRRVEWLMWMLAAFIVVIAVLIAVVVYEHGGA